MNLCTLLGAFIQTQKKQNLIKTINQLQPILHTLTSGYRSELLS